MKKLFVLMVVGAVVYWQLGDGSISRFFSQTAGEQTQEENESGSVSDEEIQLLELLARLEEFARDAKDAQADGDKAALKESLEEILRLDREYQEAFELYQSDLTGKTANEISRQHYEMMRSLPRL